MSEKEPEQRYGEREVRAILARAAELAAEEASGGPHTGTTLAQLEQAAAELGLDPRLMRQAAAEVGGTAGTSPLVRLLGGPWSFTTDRFAPGAIGPAGWVRLLDDLRAATGRVGHPKELGEGFEWLSDMPDPLHLSVTPYESGTRIRLTSRFGVWGGMFYSLCLAATIIGGVLGGIQIEMRGPSALGLALLAGVPAAALASARVSFGRLCARKRRKAGELAALVESRIARGTLDTAPVRRAELLPDEMPVTSRIGASG